LDGWACRRRKIANLPGLQIYGVYTHLPFQDRAGAALTESGLELLRGVIREIQDGGIEIQYVEALASAGLLDGMDPVGNLVNPGHLLYGLSPFAEPTADTSGLRKVLTSLRTRLIHIGEPVEPNTESPSVGAGYGIDRTLRRGIVPVGFFQGYRLPARGAFMLCGGVRVPVMRVSLEHAMLDLSEVSSAAVGDEVVIVGEQGDERIDIEEIAEWRDERTVYSTISLCERATSVWS
jgi:alanine racemase